MVDVVNTDYSEGMKFYQAIKSSGSKSDDDWQSFYTQFLNCAVKYAQERANWALLEAQQRAEADGGRTAIHNAFIAALNILTRYVKSMGNEAEWEPILGEDRKEIGDLACYVHCALSIESR